MKQVIVGSKNPVKLNATKEAFERVFPEEIFEFITVDAPSDIPDQPFGDEETRRGAKNRAEACRAEYPDAGYYAGLEGGLNDLGSELWVYAWMCVIDTSGKCGYGRTSSFLLPHKICELIHDGRELGDATDIVFNDTNTKHKGGTIGILTSEKITRKDFYREAMIFALIPFLNPDLYWRTPECPEALPRGVRKFGELPNGARSIVPRTISPAATGGTQVGSASGGTHLSSKTTTVSADQCPVCSASGSEKVWDTLEPAGCVLLIAQVLKTCGRCGAFHGCLK